MKKNKTILIGIDGCDFRILNPLVEDGHLPTFSEIVKNGCYGTLMSTTPPNSLPAWTSIFTGVNPGKHGIIDFAIKENGRLSIATAKHRKVELIWSFLTQAGFRQIIVNEPISYPPEEVSGIMLTGFSTPPGSKNFVYPSKLKADVDKACGGYTPELEFGFDKIIAQDRGKGYELINSFAKKVYNAAVYLAKNYEWNFLSVIFTSTDRLQHFYFDDQSRIRSHYKIIDNMIKNVIGLEPDANILVISDHGFGPLKKCFYINTWLKEQGITSEQKSVFTKLLSDVGLTYSKLVSILLRIKLYSFFAKVTPPSVKQKIPKVAGEDLVDYESSPVFLPTINGGLYLNGYSILPKVIQLLKRCTINNEKPIQSIYSKNDVWWGPYVSRAPDIALIPNYGYEISPRFTASSLEIPSKFGDIRTGTHRTEGIFIAHGPDIKEKFKLNTHVQTWDITPTLLHLLGLPIPSYMDGRVLKEIFKEGSNPSLRLVKRYNIEKERIKRVIKKLR